MFPFRRRPIKYNPRVPGGLIAHTDNGYYLVKQGKRFRFVSNRARESWKLKVVETTEESLKGIKVVGNVGFRDGTLIRDMSTSKIYLISDYKKMHVVDPDSLPRLGFRRKDIITVSDKEAAAHGDGENLSV